jgi:hypothetical protein
MIHYFYGLHCKPNQNEQQLYPLLALLLNLFFSPNFSYNAKRPNPGLKLQMVLIHALWQNLWF